MGVTVRFLAADGRPLATVAVEAARDLRLLDVAKAAGLPLEGTCGGQMACSTCHVIVAAADWPRLPAPGVEEEDLLDLTPHAARHSRLACQVRLADAPDGLTVSLPPG